MRPTSTFLIIQLSNSRAKITTTYSSMCACVAQVLNLVSGCRRSFAHDPAPGSSGMGRADPYASINHPTHP